MTALGRRVAALLQVPEEAIERLAGGDLSESLLVKRPGRDAAVAKRGHAIPVEAAMLRSIAGAGLPVPTIEAEFEDILLLHYVENDGVFSANAWADIGRELRRLHGNIGEGYGWPVDYALGTVALDNRQKADWRAFWFEQRLAATAAMLDRPWRERIAKLEARLTDLLPPQPPPSLLHGDLWSGNILVSTGKLAALIDPACYYGDAEVDLAMLSLFDTPPAEFWEAYGPLEPGWEERRPIYQLFPALVHLRLFGAAYAGSVDRLLVHLKV